MSRRTAGGGRPAATVTSTSRCRRAPRATGTVRSVRTPTRMPMTMAMSATLNTGQRCRSMKSTTYPWTTRSTALARAPPSTMPSSTCGNTPGPNRRPAMRMYAATSDGHRQEDELHLREEPEGGAAVLDVVDGDRPAARHLGAERDVLGHQPLGEVVEDEHHRRGAEQDRELPASARQRRLSHGVEAAARAAAELGHGVQDSRGRAHVPGPVGSPKSTRPRRMMVAPCAMATSKSPLIPMLRPGKRQAGAVADVVAEVAQAREARRRRLRGARAVRWS